MKTIELKWIEDDNHVVAEDAYIGMKELIETGVFPNLKVECKDDTLYITGEPEDLDKAVMKIQKDYVKYGQIMIKEAHKQAEGIRLESFNKDVQEIFDYTLKEFETFKESTKSTDYITRLGDFHVKFNRLKEAAKGKDRKIIQNYIDEIVDLTESIEDKKIKPVYNKQLKDQLSNLENWGLVEESLSKEDYQKKYDTVAKVYAEETGKDIESVYDELMDNPNLSELVEGPMDEYEIVSALMSESAKLTESMLSPSELKKKLTRVAAKWAYETGVKYEVAYNELRKKKSVKDMLDFYTVDEIIDDLKKKKKEVDDELEDGLDESLSTKKYYSKYTLLKKAKKLNASEVVDYDEYKAIKSTQLMNEIGYSMDVNGNKSAALWVGDRDGKFYYATNPSLLVRT
jgi:hypothetical protein